MRSNQNDGRDFSNLPSVVGAADLSNPSREPLFKHGDLVRLKGADPVSCPVFCVSHFFFTERNELCVVEVCGWHYTHGLIALKAPEQCFVAYVKKQDQ